MIRTFFIFFILIPSLCCTSLSSYGVSSYEKEEALIPDKPSSPPLLKQKSPADVPHCERYFVYRGKKLECDSNANQDAERLRPIMVDVPSALAELDTYQENHDKLRYTAYFGTIGVLLILGGVFSRPVDFSTGAIRFGGYLALLGAGVTLNSILYGWSVLKTNEAHLSRAVENYNRVHPTDPVQLQFSTDIHF